MLFKTIFIHIYTHIYFSFFLVSALVKATKKTVEWASITNCHAQLSRKHTFKNWHNIRNLERKSQWAQQLQRVCKTWIKLRWRSEAAAFICSLIQKLCRLASSLPPPSRILWPPDSLFKMAAWVENPHISNTSPPPASCPHNFHRPAGRWDDDAGDACGSFKTRKTRNKTKKKRLKMTLTVEDDVGVME